MNHTSPTVPLTTDAKDICLVQASARWTSLGAGVLLALCLLLSAIWIMALLSPEASITQHIVAALLGTFGWLYFLNSLTEHIFMGQDCVFFESLLTRRRRIQLNDLEGILLIHEGLNLEQGIETLEIRRHNRPVERLSLGPCWHRHELENFLHSIEARLESPKLLEEVR